MISTIACLILRLQDFIQYRLPLKKSKTQMYVFLKIYHHRFTIFFLIFFSDGKRNLFAFPFAASRAKIPAKAENLALIGMQFFDQFQTNQHFSGYGLHIIIQQSWLTTRLSAFRQQCRYLYIIILNAFHFFISSQDE